jgi:hypothetical protein
MRVVEKFYSVTETAMLLSCSNDTVVVRMKAGEFGYDCVNLSTGNKRPDYRIPASGINGYLERIRVFTEPGIAARNVGELRRKAALTQS